MSLARQNAEKVLANRVDLIKGLDGSRNEQVRDFHDLYECPMGAEPTQRFEHLSDERVALRLGLNLEETTELFRDGFGVTLHATFEVDGVIYYSILEAIKASLKRDLVGACDALGDISYVSDGFAIEMGVNLDEVVDEIHASNMTKPDEDGKPVLREDGKVLKGPYYTKPNLESVIFKKV